jgi:hypothetical protein
MEVLLMQLGELEESELKEAVYPVTGAAVTVATVACPPDHDQETELPEPPGSVSVPERSFELKVTSMITSVLWANAVADASDRARSTPRAPQLRVLRFIVNSLVMR